MQKTNNNGFTMEMFAEMVADKIKESTACPLASTPKVNGGDFAKTSGLYGQELCGYMYSPYTVRRFLPRQFKGLMEEFNLNVSASIKRTVTYRDAVNYMVEECKKLDMLSKRDKIAFEERKHFWTVSDMIKFFERYCIDAGRFMNHKAAEKLNEYSVKTVYIKGLGHVNLKRSKELFGDTYIRKITVEDRAVEQFRVAYAKLDELTPYSTYGDVYKIVCGLNVIHITGRYKYTWYTNADGSHYRKNPDGFDLPKVFVEGYLKSGAYYTLKNEVIFNNATIRNYEGLRYKGRYAVDFMRRQLADGMEGYKFYAMLKEVYGK